MDKVKSFFSSAWGIVVGAFTILLILLGIEQSRRKNAENKAAQLQVDKDDAVLSTKIDAVNEQLNKESKSESDLDSSHKDELSSHENLTNEEKERWWNKK